MTNDQIIEMAKQAGIEFATHIGITGKETTSTLGSQRIDVMQRFAQLVRNEALEEAANHCQACSIPPPGGIQTDGQFAALHLSQQIRGLKS